MLRLDLDGALAIAAECAAEEARQGSLQHGEGELKFLQHADHGETVDKVPECGC